MAINFYVIMNDQGTIKLPEWQRAIESARLPLALAENTDLEGYQGYLPCFLDEQEFGFDFCQGAVPELKEFADSDLRPPAKCYFVRLSVPAGSPADRVSVAAQAAAALASLTKEALWTDDGPVVSEPLTWADAHHGLADLPLNTSRRYQQLPTWFNWSSLETDSGVRSDCF